MVNDSSKKISDFVNSYRMSQDDSSQSSKLKIYTVLNCYSYMLFIHKKMRFVLGNIPKSGNCTSESIRN